METGGRRKEDAICAGKKRSAKERLGTKKSNPPRYKLAYGGDGQTQDGNALEDMSIPQPGVPRTIPDLSPEVIKSILATDGPLKDNGEGRNLKGRVECMEEENGNGGSLRDNTSPSRSAELLGEELAARLCEPKTE